MSKQTDRHSDDTKVISVRLSLADYYQLLELTKNSPRGHDSVGGYLAWLIETQALRRR